MRRPLASAVLGLLLALGCSTAGHAADSPHRPRTQPAPPPPPAENLVVHGQRRFSAAPMPDQAIHDPADALRDPATGAPLGKFGGAYIDASPVPPINPALDNNRSPITAGVQR